MFSFCNLTIRIFFINAWVFKIFYYLRNQIQIQVLHLSEIGSLLVYEDLDFFLIQIISFSLYYPIKPFCIGFRKYPSYRRHLYSIPILIEMYSHKELFALIFYCDDNVFLHCCHT